MKSRSSIFSFDTLHIGKLRPWGVVAALVLIVLFDVFLRNQQWVWSTVPRSQAGIVDVLEEQVIHKADEPRVVLMGSSRMRDAVSPRQLEEELKLPAGTVLNLGMTEGTPFDALMLYRRNRDVLSKADVLVIGIEEWYLNAGMRLNERDHRFASLDERIGTFRWDDTAKLMLGWVWETYDARVAWRRYLERLDLDKTQPLPISDDGRVEWREGEAATGDKEIDPAVDIDIFYRKYAESEGRLKQLKTLVEEAKKDGLHVWIIQAPWRQAYVDAVKMKHSDAYAHYRNAVATLEDEWRVPVDIIETGSDIGIPEIHFYDYGHLTTNGCEQMTSWVARRMVEHFGNLWNHTPPPADVSP